MSEGNQERDEGYLIGDSPRRVMEMVEEYNRAHRVNQKTKIYNEIEIVKTAGGVYSFKYSPTLVVKKNFLMLTCYLCNRGLQKLYSYIIKNLQKVDLLPRRFRSLCCYCNAMIEKPEEITDICIENNWYTRIHWNKRIVSAIHRENLRQFISEMPEGENKLKLKVIFGIK